KGRVLAVASIYSDVASLQAEVAMERNAAGLQAGVARRRGPSPLPTCAVCQLNDFPHEHPWGVRSPRRRRHAFVRSSRPGGAIAAANLQSSRLGQCGCRITSLAPMAV